MILPGLMKYGYSIELKKKGQTGTVALAGKTGGAIRVCLDFFCYFFASRQKSKERKNNNGSYSYTNSPFIITLSIQFSPKE